MVIEHPIAITALTKAVDAKTAREASELVPTGCIANVDVVARVTGTLKRGETQQSKQTASLMNKAMVGELLRRLGVTREAALKHMRDIAMESIVDGQLTVSKAFANANPELLLAIKQLEDQVVEQLPKHPKPGPIRVNATAELREVDVRRQDGEEESH